MAGTGGKRKGAGRKSKADEARIRDLCSPHVAGTIDKLVAIIDDEDARDSDRISAIKLLLSYGVGMPTQQINQSNTHEFTEGFDITKLYGKD
jgi:hypothetical protein